MSKSIMILKKKLETGPSLLHLRYWIQSKYKEGSILKIHIDQKHPQIHRNYVPGDRYVFFEVVKKINLPIWHVCYNQQQVEIDLNNYMASKNDEYTISLPKAKLFFTFQLFDCTDKVAQRYSSQKMEDQEKYRYNQSINDLIRSQQQFLTMFERDKGVQLVKEAEKVQNQMQMKITQQIMNVKPYEISWKKLLIIFILFLIIGSLLSQPQASIQPHKKKSKKKQKVENKKGENKIKKKSKQ